MEHSYDINLVSEQFLNVGLIFFNLIKNHYSQQNQIKAYSHPFYALTLLNSLEETPPIMSQLAKDLGITKQQLSKLINDLEEKGLVHREHDKKNRRQVYLTITPEGKFVINQLKAALISSTAQGMTIYNADELARLKDCLDDLSRLLLRFQPILPKE